MPTIKGIGESIISIKSKGKFSTNGNSHYKGQIRTNRHRIAYDSIY